MRRGDLLVAVSWRTAAHIRRRLADPGEVGTAVPTAREAVILHDPRGVAASIQREAVDWTWDAVEGRCDGWVAEETTRLAEEVHKLVAALDAGRRYPAAMQRSVLALAVGPVLAVHRRLLYGREASLFELLAELVGPRWEDAQARSLGIRAATFEDGCLASLDLYVQLAAEVEQLFDARQRRVVAHALRLAETAP
jgi:hypothetical protein